MFTLDEFLKGSAGGGETDADLEAILKTSGFQSPSQGDMHIESALTNISLAFMQSEAGFVARSAFRSVPVQMKSDVYWEYPRGQFNRNQMKERAPGDESAGANFDVETKQYLCKVYALHRNIPDQIRDNADSAFNMDRDTTNFLTMKSMLLEEIDWRDQFFDAAFDPGDVWSFVADGGKAPTTFDPTSSVNNGVAEWVAGGGTPIEDVRRGKRTVQQQTGFRPNIGVIGRDVYDELLDHPDFVGRLDSGQTPGGPAITSRQSMAAIFELDELLLMDAIENTAEVGLADNHQFIGGSNFLLLYRPSSPGLMTPAPGYNFLWAGFRGANGGAMRIKNIRIETRESDRIEIQSSFDSRLVAADLGYLFTDILG